MRNHVIKLNPRGRGNGKFVPVFDEIPQDEDI
jgi:hypothetical protein